MAVKGLTGRCAKDKAALNFTQNFWDGQDDHIGIYKPASTPIEEARERAMKKMTALIPKLKKSSRVLVMRSGWGQAVRYLMDNYKCKIDCVNPHKVQNEHLQQIVEREEWQKKVNISKGTIDALPYDFDTYELVWCQDTLSCSTKKMRVFREAHRVLQNAGRFVVAGLSYDDENGQEEKAQKLIKKLPVNEIVSTTRLDRISRRTGLQKVYTSEMTEQLKLHYQSVRSLAEKRRKDITAMSDEKTYKQLLNETDAWIEAAESGLLNWSIMVFQKINA